MKPRTLVIIALALIAALAITSGISISVAISRGRQLHTASIELAAAKTAEKARKEKADEIEKTPASDLVSASPRAGELAGARDAAADAAADRLTDAVRARAREIISGGTGGAAP